MRKLVFSVFLLSLILSLQFSGTAIGKESASEHIGHHGRGPDVENDMVFLPGGEFTMGSTPAEVEGVTKKFGSKKTFDEAACKMEMPQKKVKVKPFYIDRYEVTYAQYRKFILAAGHQPPPDWSGTDYPAEKANYPVMMVTYKDAEAYAKWAGKRLPTEAEWEFAARGADARMYPWGNDFEPGMAHTAESVHLFGGHVGLYPKDTSPYGVRGMAGNVAEWTSDWFDSEKKMRIVKGGSWAQLSHQARCASKEGIREDGMSHLIGFRCVKDAKE